MESIGIKQLRENLSRILERVEKGEIIKVSRHGKGIAELRPMEEDKEQALVAQLEAKGLLGGRGKGIIGPVKNVENLKPEKPISDFVIEDRI